MAWWPRRAEPASVAEARARDEPGWRAVPTLSRTVAPMSPIAPLGPFTSQLAAHQNPSFLRPLGHLVDPAGPSGRVYGLANPAQPVVQTATTELSLRRPWRSPASMRSASGSSMTQRIVANDPPSPYQNPGHGTVPQFVVREETGGVNEVPSPSDVERTIQPSSDGIHEPMIQRSSDGADELMIQRSSDDTDEPRIHLPSDGGRRSRPTSFAGPASPDPIAFVSTVARDVSWVAPTAQARETTVNTALPTAPAAQGTFVPTVARTQAALPVLSPRAVDRTVEVHQRATELDTPASGPEPDYAAPDYAAPDYAAPDYAAPDYAAPDYAAPDYAAPDYAAPDYPAPDYPAPGHAGRSAMPGSTESSVSALLSPNPTSPTSLPSTTLQRSSEPVRLATSAEPSTYPPAPYPVPVSAVGPVRRLGLGAPLVVQADRETAGRAERGSSGLGGELFRPVLKSSPAQPNAVPAAELEVPLPAQPAEPQNAIPTVGGSIQRSLRADATPAARTTESVQPLGEAAPLPVGPNVNFIGVLDEERMLSHQNGGDPEPRATTAGSTHPLVARAASAGASEALPAPAATTGLRSTTSRPQVPGSLATRSSEVQRSAINEAAVELPQPMPDLPRGVDSQPTASLLGAKTERAESRPTPMESTPSIDSDSYAALTFASSTAPLAPRSSAAAATSPAAAVSGNGPSVQRAAVAGTPLTTAALLGSAPTDADLSSTAPWPSVSAPVASPTDASPSSAMPAVTTPALTAPAITAPAITTSALTAPAITTPAVTTLARTTSAPTTSVSSTPAPARQSIPIGPLQRSVVAPVATAETRSPRAWTNEAAMGSPYPVGAGSVEQVSAGLVSSASHSPLLGLIPEAKQASAGPRPVVQAAAEQTWTFPTLSHARNGSSHLQRSATAPAPELNLVHGGREAFRSDHGAEFDAGTVAINNGVAQRAADGSVVFATPRFDSSPDVPTVARAEEDLPAPEPSPASTGTSGAVAASAGAAGPGAPSSGAADLDDLARRLWDPLFARLKSEFRLDRERAGLVTDMRR